MLNAIQDRAEPADEEDKRWEVTSKRYHEKLTGLISTLDCDDGLNAELTIKPYFNGAAIYVDKTICASWSPVGLAFRLPAAEVTGLIASGQARPLKYFAKSRIRQGYAMFDMPESKQISTLRTYLLQAIEQSKAAAIENLA